MKTKRWFILVGAAGLALGACGSDKAATVTTAAPANTSAASTAGSSTAGSSTGSSNAGTGSSGSTGASTPAAGSSAAGSVDCKPVKAGVLTVVTSLPGPNFWGTDETDPGSIKTGVEYDMANDIAAKCGLKMEFRNEGFDAIVAGQIPEGSYDISLSQVTITDDRAKVVDFSTGYFKADQGVLVKKGTKISSWADIAEMKVGVQASTTAEFYLMTEAKYKVKELKSFPDLTSAYEALSSGQVQSVIIDTPINLGQAAQSKGELEVVGQFKTGDEYGAIFPKGSDRKAIFNPIIKGLVDDGTVKDLTVKYFKGDPASVPFYEPS